LHAGLVERRERTLNVAGEGGGDSKRFDAAAMTLGLEQACQQLVPVVERRPGAIQVEARRADFAARDFLEHPASRLDCAGLILAREARHIAVALCALAGAELGNDVMHARAALG